ncbi:endolytic transglycosylase MltG [Argonema galeatum]|uniref:endolytic transglycosylase MltG n=1 Tax=Argonema galeatum TaxID=2942762 RepID=UPI002010F07C|nr:endolytic transglycosylase MltG [Argonema galeatum]MCL1467806.1 endolytic transglycosylase MltG [Argonema galeatum A003/A1]
MQRLSKWLFYLGLFPVTLGLCAWQGWSWWSWASAPPLASAATTASPDAEKTVQIRIPPGTSASQIGRDLESAGLIRSAEAWNLWARWLTLQDKAGFKAGTFQLSPTQSLPEIAAEITKGNEVQRSFTIPEGWSLKQMAAYFEAQGFFKAQDFLAATSQIPRDQFPWLPSGIPHLEGFLYPDTYLIAAGAVTPESVIKPMLKRFEELALPVYQTDPQKSQIGLVQWVTLASIVEKEAVVPVERPRIAGVFVRRLRLGMKLESDPTVEYGLNIQQTPDQPLTLNQVRMPSPYNTYLNRGLPPTPIASPGLASLKATLDPENTEYIFFVARYDGTHVFSRTLAEHEAAVVAIRKQRSARRQATSKPI